MRMPLIVAAALVASPAWAAEWEADPAHTQLRFDVSHFGFSEINGRFTDMNADVRFDRDDIAATEVRFVVDAASIDTGWEERDEHLRSADFFNVEEYPEITFESKSVEETGENTAKVTGDLTMLGETHEETFDVELRKIGEFPPNPEITVAGFNAAGTVDRTKYGMGFGAPALSAEIPFTLEMELTSQ